MHGLDNMKRLHWNDRVRDPEMKKNEDQRVLFD